MDEATAAKVTPPSIASAAITAATTRDELTGYLDRFGLEYRTDVGTMRQQQPHDVIRRDEPLVVVYRDPSDPSACEDEPHGWAWRTGSSSGALDSYGQLGVLFGLVLCERCSGTGAERYSGPTGQPRACFECCGACLVHRDRTASAACEVRLAAPAEIPPELIGSEQHIAPVMGRPQLPDGLRPLLRSGRMCIAIVATTLNAKESELLGLGHGDWTRAYQASWYGWSLGQVPSYGLTPLAAAEQLLLAAS